MLPNGRVVYQDSPCEDAARQSTVRPADPVPDKPLPPGDERLNAAPPTDLESIVRVLSSFQGCAQDVPGFALKHGPAFNDWRNRNASAMTLYGRDARAQQRVRENLEQQLRGAPTEPQARADRAEACEKEAPTWFASRPRP